MQLGAANAADRWAVLVLVTLHSMLLAGQSGHEKDPVVHF